MNQAQLIVAMGALGAVIGIGVVSLLPGESATGNRAAEPDWSTITPSAAGTSTLAGNSASVLSSTPEKSTLALIDQLAAHPQDPQNTTGGVGVSDETLASTPTARIADLIEDSIDYAEQHANPRYLFALGRAAWIHGDDAFATELLEIAASRGSMAAEAYLGRITDDLSESVARFQSAVAGGFSPAVAWLQEAELLLAQEKAAQQQQVVATRQGEPDYSAFTMDEFVEAFYDGNTSQYRGDPLMVLTYVSGINETLSDQGMLFMLNNPKMLMREVDPTLGTEAARKLSTNSQFVQQTASVGLQNFWGALQEMAKVRQSGGSVSQEVAAMNQALMGKNGYSKNSKGATYVTINEMKQIGAKDGRILALMVDENPDAFRKIYRNMVSFVRSL